MTTSWLELAISKDKNRLNLGTGWLYEDKLIYCDGYRMHYQYNLPMIDQPRALGLVESNQCPNFHLFDLNSKAESCVEIKPKQRKKLYKVLKGLTMAISDRFVPVDICVASQNQFQLIIKHQLPFQFQIGTDTTLTIGDSASDYKFVTTVNLKFLTDALAFSGFGNTGLHLSLKHTYDGKPALFVQHNDLAAFVMPMAQE